MTKNTNCAKCGTLLYALNMDDDDETLCQNCAGKIKQQLFSDPDLNTKPDTQIWPKRW